jgi:hypothetical protein
MKWYYIGSIIFSVFATIVLFGSSYMQITDEQLIQKATYVIIGDVINISEQVSDNYPFQFVNIKVIKLYKNNYNNPLREGDSIIVKQIGGEAGGMYYKADGLAKFEINTTIFVSVSPIREEPEYLYVVAGEQGKFDLESDGNMIRDTTESVFVRRGKDGRIEFNNGKVDSCTLSDMEITMRKLGYSF